VTGARPDGVRWRGACPGCCNVSGRRGGEVDTSQLLTVAEELAEVTRLLAVDDVPAAMSRYVERIVRTVPGCDGAVISASGRNRVDTVAGTWRPPALTPAA